MPTNSKLRFIEDCENARIIARNDINKDEIKILLAGGIAPIVYSTDKQFEEKYQIEFHEYGDLSAKYECMKIYNFEVFRYLTEKYGKSWRREIRKDAFGLKEWKKWNRKNRKNK